MAALDSAFEHFPILETQRLILRQFTIGDAAVFFEYKGKASVTENYGQDLQPSVEQTVE